MIQNNSMSVVNELLARQINQEARTDPNSPYANKFVGIANGQVVVVGDDLDNVACQVRQAEPDPAKTYFIEASVDYDAVQEIWKT